MELQGKEEEGYKKEREDAFGFDWKHEFFVNVFSFMF